jgi:hypothetical protein
VQRAEPGAYKSSAATFFVLLALAVLSEAQRAMFVALLGQETTTAAEMDAVGWDGSDMVAQAFDVANIGGAVETEWTRGNVGTMSELLGVVIVTRAGVYRIGMSLRGAQSF